MSSANFKFDVETNCNEALILIEDMLLSVSGKGLKEFGLPIPTQRPYLPRIPMQIQQETSYDKVQLAEFLEENKNKLTDEQSEVCETVKSQMDEGGIIFLDAPGGTGKTFTSKFILAETRLDDKIALAVASTGIASSLLPGGTTAHRTFKIPLDLDSSDKPPSGISKGTAQVFHSSSL